MESAVGKEFTMREIHKRMGVQLRNALIYSYAMVKSKGKANAKFVIHAGKIRSNYKVYAENILKDLQRRIV